MFKRLGRICLLILLAGCAAVPYTLNFQPQGPPPQDWRRFQDRRVALLEIEDARPQKPGVLLYSGAQGTIELGVDPLAALTDAFERELRFAGFFVVRAKNLAEAREAGVERIFKITLENLEVAPQKSWFQRWVAKLGYRVDIYDGKGELLAQGAGFYGEQEILGLRKQPTIQEALDGVVGKVVQDFLLSPGLQKYL